MQGSSSNLTTDTGRFKNRRKAQSSSGVKNCRSKLDHHVSKSSKQQGSKQQHQIMIGSRRTSHDIKMDTVTSTKSFDPVYLPNDDMNECNESSDERMQEEALERPKLPQHHRSTSEDVQSLMKSLLDLSHLHDTSDAELFGDEGLSSTYNNNNSTDGNSAIQVTVRDDIDQNSRDQQIESIPFLKRKIESLEHSLVTVSHKNDELDGALRSLSKSYTNLKKTMNYESEERTALQSRMYDIECNMQQLMEELTEEKKTKRIMNTRSSSSRI
uniref:Uncharacterized protein n=1 Tax=Proboscia inermis TaxID=420281 RepID=A0A7S0CKB6_9STRA|mmetsp:Transcript_5758/g.6018  ORF Transcript_5758/g.6018 Transcript_5758/m.6018 type:complete len:270 (+) Transcript_5758:3-812(+)